MTDITERLRRLYTDTGMNYVQEAADEIERLRQRVAELEAEPHVQQCNYNLRTALECIADDLQKTADGENITDSRAACRNNAALIKRLAMVEHTEGKQND